MGKGDILGDSTIKKVTWQVTNKGCGIYFGICDSVLGCGKLCGKVGKRWDFAGGIWCGEFGTGAWGGKVG